MARGGQHARPAGKGRVVAYDFPQSPVTGTVVSNGGISYRWDAVKWVANASTATAAPFVNNVGRNLIHNPLFNVQQRGAGTFTANASNAIYTLDRWVIQAGIAGDSISLLANATDDASRTAIGDEAATNMASLTVAGAAGAGSMCRLSQKIETVRRLSGKAVTVSFWAVGNVANRVGVSIDQYFGTGGSPSASVNGNGQSVAITTSWARYSFTIAVPSASGKTVGTNSDACTILNIWFSAGSSWSAGSGGVPVQGGPWFCNLWGIQLEIGSVATPLEKPDPQQDLAKCQRFYQTASFNLGYYGAAGGQITHTLGFVAGMRAVPTMAVVSPVYANASGGAVSASNGNNTLIYYTVTAAGHAFFSGTYTASADL